MLLNDYRQILEIDYTITNLHRQLADLYQQRIGMFSEHNISQTEETGTTATLSPDVDVSFDLAAAVVESRGEDYSPSAEQACYNKLAKVWAAHGICIPTFVKLKKKLARANDTLLNLRQSWPDANFEIVLLPPTKLYKFSNSPVALQFNCDMTVQNVSVNAWKMFVVDTRPDGASIEDYKTFIKNRGIKVDGQIMAGLNTREYAVLVTIIGKPIDCNSWSLLISDSNPVSEMVPCVMNMSNKYSFDIDSTNVPVGENHFRAAVEVK